MKQIDEVNDVQKLLRRQKAYMKGILVMQEKLFDIQCQISELMLKKQKRRKRRNENHLTCFLLKTFVVCLSFRILLCTECECMTAFLMLRLKADET